MESTGVQGRLALAFMQARGDRAALPSRVDTQLADGLRTGRVKYPEVDLADEVFAAYVAERCPAGPIGDNTLTRLFLDDLFLAASVAHQDPVGLAVFDRHFLANLRRSISSFSQDADFLAEVTQRVRVRLFGGASSSIRQYGGVSSLATWLGVVARRIAMDMQRAGRTGLAARVEDWDPSELLPVPANQEAEQLRRRYSGAYLTALKACLAGLHPEQRNLLRLYHEHGLTLEKIAALKDVRASTIQRRLKAIYEHVLAGVRASLIRQGDTSKFDFDSVTRVIRSQLDVNLSSILATSK